MEVGSEEALRLSHGGAEVCLVAGAKGEGQRSRRVAMAGQLCTTRGKRRWCLSPQSTNSCAVRGLRSTNARQMGCPVTTGSPSSATVLLLLARLMGVYRGVRLRKPVRRHAISSWRIAVDEKLDPLRAMEDFRLPQAS